MRSAWMIAAIALLLLELERPAALAASEPLRIATFDIDATPPVGSMLAYDRMVRADDLPLRCRGVVLFGADEPIVLCAVDWIGISNEGHDAFRDALARGAGTIRQRVAVHTLHQHDAPDCDFLAERILRDAGAVDPGRYDGAFARQVLERLETAVRDRLDHAQTVTHVGFGAAEVREVASNRRILGPDGRVRVTRYTATRDPAVRAEPEGTIDPNVSLISFFDGDRPLAVLSYYACHPQSYYRTGIANPDFPGIARFIRRQAVPEAMHVHFNGAGGNIGAGKYNDGNHENRITLAMRLADGMRRAWDQTQRVPVTADAMRWDVESVALPPAPHLDETRLKSEVAKAPDDDTGRAAADKLAWLTRCRSGHRIDIGQLSIGKVRMLHLPGELFVEYQLAAKAMHPELNVVMAAYGDYGPGYIGTRVAYGQGGYETSERASDVAPEVEDVLMSAIARLLGE